MAKKKTKADAFAETPGRRDGLPHSLRGEKLAEWNRLLELYADGLLDHKSQREIHDEFVVGVLGMSWHLTTTKQYLLEARRRHGQGR